MHLRTLSLRNYRVYRSVDLEFPDGLIGIYGPNGAGKSSLIEAVRYGLYGDSRTAKDELRSAGVREELRVELVFEHEGNTYDVRRRLKGVNFTPEVEVYLNGQLAVQSVREANAFLARVLGMDQRAFLASVCAQQKELTAFATMAAADRRRLVLDLLGVSPVERALARAREEARDARRTAEGARAGLPDLGALERAVAEAAAEVAEAERAEQAADRAEAAARAGLAEARAVTAEAEEAARKLAGLRERAALARAEAEGLRRQADGHERRAADADALLPRIREREAEQAGLAAAAAPLESLDRAREAHTERAGLARALRDAEQREEVDARALAYAVEEAAGGAGLAAARMEAEDAVVAADRDLDASRERYGELSEALGEAAARRKAGREVAEGTAGLDPAAPCPTCGQPLGPAYTEVRERHRAELEAAAAAHERVVRERDACTREGTRLAAARKALARALEAAREAEGRAVRAAVRAEEARAALDRVRREVAARRVALDAAPDPGFDEAAWTAARQAAVDLQQLVVALGELRARAERATAERDLAKEALARADEADGRAAALDAEAVGLGDAEARLAAASAAEREASEAAGRAHGERRRATEALAGAGRRHGDQARALADGRERHEAVAALEEEAGYLARVVDLVVAFRLHLVSRLGRRLSAEAAGLFAELTDNEYQDLVVDPEDYSVRIADAGVEYELARYSGSENDLASLSLRVAVSLVIAEGAGELGVLVLDEVLGALDRERRERMLAALTTLQGRFRQVLLVTHNDEVKDLLPAAIEVRRGPYRTSTATVLG